MKSITSRTTEQIVLFCKQQLLDNAHKRADIILAFDKLVIMFPEKNMR